MNEQVNSITEEAKVINKEQQEIGSELRKIKNSYRDKQVGWSGLNVTFSLIYDVGPTLSSMIFSWECIDWTIILIPAI